MLDMERREFIALIGGGVLLLAAKLKRARAQQPAMPVVGYLSARSPQDTAHLAEAFRRGLAEAGFVEGQNVLIEYRWAFGQHDRLPGLAADLVRNPLTVLVTTGGEVAALAAKAATSTIPIAFIVGTDPVKLGLAASYNRPGGNATGINILTNSLEPKRLELLRELVPQASAIGALFDPTFLAYEDQFRDVREAARALDLQVHELRASTDAEIDLAYETVARQRIAAVTVTAGPFFDTRRDRLVALAARHAVPTMYHFREFPAAGAHELRGRFSRDLSSDWSLRRRHSQGRKASRVAYPSADQVRAGPQS